jgi:hypothetical protein
MGVWMGLEVTFSSMAALNSLGSLLMMYLAYGLFLFALGRVHGQDGTSSRLQGIYLVFGLMLTMAVTFIFSFRGAGAFFADYGRELSKFRDRPVTFFYGLLILCVAAAVYAYLKGGRGGMKEAWVVFTLMALAAFGVLQLNFPETHTEYSYGYGGSHPDKMLIYPIVNNVVLMAEVVGALALGYRERRTALINAALAFFVLLVFARYFDFFWELLPRSVFFMLGGVVLITGGIFLEKKRRRVISDIRRGAAA